MRLIFAGTPEPAVTALQKLLDSDHEVVAVVTQPDRRKGRGRTFSPSPVALLASAHGIHTFKPTSLSADSTDGQEFRKLCAALKPECFPVVAFGQLIPKDLLDVAPHGWVNLHFSLLPAWRGAAPVQAAIRAGDSITGVSTFRIDQGLDTGPLLLSREEGISPIATADSLLSDLADVGADLLVETMDGLAQGTISPVEQSGEPSYAGKISTSDARINWQESAEIIDRSIQAHTSSPGAWTMLIDAQKQTETRVKLGPVKISESREMILKPGAIAVTDHGVLVGTATAPVELGLIQPAGKKQMKSSDWVRGYQLSSEASFQ